MCVSRHRDWKPGVLFNDAESEIEVINSLPKRERMMIGNLNSTLQESVITAISRDYSSIFLHGVGKSTKPCSKGKTRSRIPQIINLNL